MKFIRIISVVYLLINCSLFAYNERELIASCLYLEARGEGRQGVEYVAMVIQNRANRAGSSLSEVVTKPMQFSCFNQGIVIKYDAMCLDVAKKLESGRLVDISNGAYFYQRKELPQRKWHKIKLFTYKNHTFYK